MTSEKLCEICDAPLSRRNGQWPKTCSPECKEARTKKLRKEKYAANREEAKRKTREWYAANKERAAERGREHREANQEKIRARKRAYVAANAEKVSAQKKAWYEANRDRILAERAAKQTPESRAEAARRTREWARLNPERKTEVRRQWYLNNTERAMAAFMRRRARKRAVPVDDVSLAELLEDQESLCYLCGCEIDEKFAYPHPMSGSIDHVIPLVRGGTGLRDNLRAAHLVCNLRKGTKLLEELAS